MGESASIRINHLIKVIPFYLDNSYLKKISIEIVTLSIVELRYYLKINITIFMVFEKEVLSRLLVNVYCLRAQ